MHQFNGAVKAQNYAYGTREEPEIQFADSASNKQEVRLPILEESKMLSLDLSKILFRLILQEIAAAGSRGKI